MVHGWAGWLYNPCRLGAPQRFKAGHKISTGTQVGAGGYITTAAWGVANASEQGTKSEVAHKWAGWLHNPAAWGVPNASKRGIESEVAHK